MKIKTSPSRKVFLVLNYLFLALSGIVCILPFINLLAISFSSATPVSLGEVTFCPKEFTLKSYEFITQNTTFFKSFLVSIVRVVLGVTVNLVLIVLTAYPLSKSKEQFRARNIYSWFFVITILFNAGMIPTFLVVRYTGLKNTIWSMILPGALPVFSMLVVMNFLRGLPRELEEAAYLDGASHIQTLVHVVLPLMKPALATVALFSIVSHWNAWFDGMLYMARPERQPLMTYLRTIIINPSLFFGNSTSVSSTLSEASQYINTRTIRAAQLIIAAFPMLVIYPFIQKYFTTGLVMGSVKG